jgi:hypothetical protein
MKRLLGSALLFALAACAEAPADTPQPLPPEAPTSGNQTPDAQTPGAQPPDDCGASAYAGLIGKPLADPAVPPASPELRHIRPGDAVTEDYRIERMNIYATEAGVIEKVTCG